MGNNDLTEASFERMIEELAISRKHAPLSMKPMYILLTDDSLRKLGWSKKKIAELRKLEQQCLR